MFYFRGICYERSHQWPNAEADLKKALELYPDQPLVLNYLGYSWVDQGVHLDEGMDMIRRAVEQRPDDGYIVDSLGWAYFRTGNYDEAVKNLERAVELKPDDPTINDHLGDAYWRVGRTLEAHFQWSHAKDLNPEPEDLPKIEAKLKDGLPDDTSSSADADKTEEGPATAGDGVRFRCARRERAGQSQSDAAGARPPRRRLSRDRKPGGVRRDRRSPESLRRAASLRSPCAGRAPRWQATDADNLVLKAARALAARVDGLRTGAFHLDKTLPVAAGLGGGSADAAAALRLLARANDLSIDDPRLYEAARATGADVPVCLDPRARLMRGIGEILSEPLELPALPAVLVNPGVALATKAVFAGWKPAAASPRRRRSSTRSRQRQAREQLLQFLSGAVERSRSAPRSGSRR